MVLSYSNAVLWCCWCCCWFLPIAKWAARAYYQPIDQALQTKFYLDDLINFFLFNPCNMHVNRTHKCSFKVVYCVTLCESVALLAHSAIRSMFRSAVCCAVVAFVVVFVRFSLHQGFEHWTLNMHCSFDQFRIFAFICLSIALVICRNWRKILPTQ